MRRDRGDLPRLVRLDTADGHQRVATLGKRLGNQVLELAGLVAAERQAAIAVLALGVELDLAAKMRAQSLQGLDWRRPEGERMAREALQIHGSGLLAVGHPDVLDLAGVIQVEAPGGSRTG